MPTATLEYATTEQLIGPADFIYDQLIPQGSYKEYYQPAWPDRSAVIEAIEELQDMEPVTTFDQVEAFHAELTAIANGELDLNLGVAGRCADRLFSDIGSTEELHRRVVAKAAGIVVEHEVVETSGMVNGVRTYKGVRRDFNWAKPRTDAEQQNPDTGLMETAWQGDSVNGQEFGKRSPHADNMVAASIQSRDVTETIEELTGEHIPTAHELLLLPHEIGMLRLDPRTGKLYSLGADMLWVGDRTKNTNSPQINLLAKLANPVGVKLGPDTTPDLVSALAEKLNPENKAGRLTFMIRIGLENEDKMDETIAAIKEFAPNSIIVYDPHGDTKKDEGWKIRAVSNIINSVKTLANICHKYQLPLHGALLETSSEIADTECVEELGQIPGHKPDVDPLFSMEQMHRIFTAIAQVLGRKAMELAA